MKVAMSHLTYILSGVGDIPSGMHKEAANFSLHYRRRCTDEEIDKLLASGKLRKNMTS
jgi:hypothetical protein